MAMGRVQITEEWGFLTVKSSVLDRLEQVKSEWETKNKRKIIPSDFVEILLENYTQDYTGQAQRLEQLAIKTRALADKCTGCTEEDCVISLDDTCAKTRREQRLND